MNTVSTPLTSTTDDDTVHPGKARSTQQGEDRRSFKPTEEMTDDEDNKQQVNHKEQQTVTMLQTPNVPTTPHKVGETPRDQKKALENNPMEHSTVENMDHQILTEGIEDHPMQQETVKRHERMQSPKGTKKLKTEKNS
jgi:hypothetical protein